MKIYDQHAAAFANVSAYVITQDGEKVGTVAIKFPKDGAGRLYAYVHWLGSHMVRGMAGGYGYDKRTAAMCDAAKKLTHGANNANADSLIDFSVALQKAEGHGWQTALEKAGFAVLQAI